MEYNEAALQKVREDRLLIEAVDQWLYEKVAPHLGRRVLEIGCGLGNFTRHLIDSEFYLGTETSVDSIVYVQQVFADHTNMRFVVADATAPAFTDFASHAFDTVFSLNVFEHIEDHVLALRNASSVLAPGGKVILVVPAHAWLYGSIDRAIGHYRRYTKEMMTNLFQEVGLNCVTLNYLNALGALGWFVNGRLRRQQTPPSGQLRLFNLLVPFLKRVEHIVPVPFGLVLVAVGQKST